MAERVEGSEARHGAGLDGAAGSSPGRSRRRKRRAAGGALALAIVAAGLAIWLASGSSPRHSSDTGVPAGDTTVVVTRRTLSESATVSGTLGYGGERALYDRLAGTFTWLPAVGASIGRGGTLFRVNDLPVVLLYGSLPAYRALKEGVADGPDVAELNANLIDLGYDPYGAIADDEAFGAATAAAVRRWQKAEDLPETGEVELGRVVFAPGAQRITAVHVALGQDPPGAGTSSEPSSSGQPSSEKEPSKGKSPSKPSGEKGKPSGGRSPSKSSREKDKSPAGKSPSGSSAPDGSDSKGSGSDEQADSPGAKGDAEAAGAAEEVLSTTSTQQIVQLKVKPEQQQLAHLGERVQVLLPGNRTVAGRITAVGTVASSGEKSPGSEKDDGDESGEATVEVTVTLDRSVAHLDEAPASVELVKSVHSEVLTVPATALIGTAGGGYAIEALEGGRRVAVPVTPGMFANGYVQVEGRGVREGMTVIESE